LDISEGENVETNTDSQPKRLSSPKKRLNKNDEITSKLISNDWNPFERCDGRILVALHKRKLQNLEESPL